MSNSIYDTNPLKESESLELEQRLLTSVNIQFDYYPITCRDIQKTPNAIHSIYRGNANHPNIILNNNEYFPTYYQSSELAIYSKLHDGKHQAELIIKHTPVSGNIIPVYLCFFINSLPDNSNKPSTPSSSSLVRSINAIIQSTEPLDVDISPLLTPYTFTEKSNKDIQITWKIYETVNNNGKCMVVLIDNPFYLDKELIKQIPQNKTQPFKVVNTVIKTNQTVEAFEDVKIDGSDNTALALSVGTNNNVMTCDMIPDTEYGDINVVQMPIQIGKDKTDTLYFLNVLVYLCVSVALLAMGFYGSPILFDICIRNIAKLRPDYDPNYNSTYILFLVGWIVIFTVITFLCLYFGVSGKTTDIILTTIGVFFGFATVITVAGIRTNSEFIKKIT